MFNHLKTIATAATMLAAAPALASAQAVAFGNAPITIKSVTAEATLDVTGFTLPTSYAVFNRQLRSSNDVNLDYVNSGDAPATSITFLLRSGNTSQTIIANGNFAPGAEMRQTYSENADVDGTPSVSVAEVRLADGAIWRPAQAVSVR